VPTFKKVPKSKVMENFFLSFILYLIILFVYFKEIVFECRTKSVGYFGDAFGTMWNTSILVQQSFPPWKRTTLFSNAPSGEVFWTADWWSSLFVKLTSYIFGTLFGPICSYNLVVFFGMLFTACCMWFLIFTLTRHQIISFVTGLGLMFGPFMLAKIHGHLNYVFLGVIPLVLAIALMSIQRYTKRNWVILSVVSGVSCYFDGYLTILIFAIFALTVVFGIVLAKNDKSRAGEFSSIILSSFIFLCLISPLLSLTFLWTGQESSVKRSYSELFAYSSEAWHYILPGRNNQYYSKYFGAYQDRNLGGSNFSENSLFIGYAFLISILFYTIYSIITRYGSKLRKSKLFQIDLNIVFLMFIALIGIAISIQPAIHIFGFSIPTPSWLIFNLTPSFRTISRWGILTVIGIQAVGAICLVKVLKLLPSLRKIIISCFILLILLDIGAPRAFTLLPSNLSESPDVYKWIQQNTPKSSIILDVIPFTPDGIPLNWALIHGRRIANSTRSNEPINQTLLFPGDQTFRCVANIKEIDYLVFHPDLFGNDQHIYFDGIQKVKDFPLDEGSEFSPWTKASIYKIDRNNAVNSFIEYLGGFGTAEIRGTKSFRWINGKTAYLNLKSSEKRFVKFTLESFGVENLTMVKQSNLIVWSGKVPVEGVTIEFEADPNEIITIESRNSNKISALIPSTKDDRVISVGLSNLEIKGC
jgi:hypothetical protein